MQEEKIYIVYSWSATKGWEHIKIMLPSRRRTWRANKTLNDTIKAQEKTKAKVSASLEEKLISRIKIGFFIYGFAWISNSIERGTFISFSHRKYAEPLNEILILLNMRVK
jgi:hypothetical protein